LLTALPFSSLFTTLSLLAKTDWWSSSADRDRLDEEMGRLKANLLREQAWAHADDDDELRHAERAEEAAAAMAAAMDQVSWVSNRIATHHKLHGEHACKH
jgi:hypothetical protein